MAAHVETHGDKTLRQWLQEGPFTLILSSSFFGMYAHTGVALALEEAGIAPSALAGSSAGSVVAAGLAAGMHVRHELLPLLLSLQRTDIIANWLEHPGWGLSSFKPQRLQEALPAQSFEECERPLYVSTWDIMGWHTRVFTKGPLVPAVMASCAVPLLFQPVWHDGRYLWDGGVADLAGCRGVPRTDRVLYHHCSTMPQALAGVAQRFPHSVTLDFSGLPFPNPYRMQVGVSAVAAARDALTVALDTCLPEMSSAQGCSLELRAPQYSIEEARQALTLPAVVPAAAAPQLPAKL